jgi:hypothetical protein
MDKLEYVDWPTQNVDRDETYTYSCLYHWIEESLYSIKYLYRYIYIYAVEFWLKIYTHD